MPYIPVVSRLVARFRLHRVQHGRRSRAAQAQAATEIVGALCASYAARGIGYSFRQEDRLAVDHVFGQLANLRLTAAASPQGRDRTTPQIEQQLAELGSLLADIKLLCDRNAMSLDDNLERRLRNYLLTYPN